MMGYYSLLAEPRASPSLSPSPSPAAGNIVFMGRRAAPTRRIESAGQVFTIIGGVLLIVVGVLWMLFFLLMLIFGGLDLFAPVANGMNFQGPVILGLASVGFMVAITGRIVADSARRSRTPQRRS